MSEEFDLEEALQTWLLYHAPGVLQDPELFTRLLHFIHRLLCDAVRQERLETLRRALCPSRS